MVARLHEMGGDRGDMIRWTDDHLIEDRREHDYERIETRGETMTVTMSRRAAAAAIGVCERTLLRWERLQGEGRVDYADLPKVSRVAHSGRRVYTPEVVALIKAWSERTV